MHLIARWWKGGTGVVAAEYLLLATIVCVALVVGCTNLATALHVDSDAPAVTAPASADGGTEQARSAPGG